MKKELQLALNSIKQLTSYIKIKSYDIDDGILVAPDDIINKHNNILRYLEKYLEEEKTQESDVFVTATNGKKLSLSEIKEAFYVKKYVRGGGYYTHTTKVDGSLYHLKWNKNCGNIAKRSVAGSSLGIVRYQKNVYNVGELVNVLLNNQ